MCTIMRNKEEKEREGEEEESSVGQEIGGPGNQQAGSLLIKAPIFHLDYLVNTLFSSLLYFLIFEIGIWA